MNWKTKYRPKTIDEFVGNASIVSAFVESLTGNDKERAFMISGQYGIGKTSLARIGATEYLGATDFNITEINASSDNGIDMVRTLENLCRTSTAKNRIWILDEFHAATKNAQKAILKLLEEGSEKDFFFICTTDPGSIIPMIQSRCGKFPLELPEDMEIKRKLRKISRTEDVMIAPEVTLKILDKAEGHVRDAVGMLQAVSTMEEEEALHYLSKITTGSAESVEAYELVKALYSGNGKTVKRYLDILKKNGENPEGIRRFILAYGSSTLLRGWRVLTAQVMENFEEPYFDGPTSWPKFILDCFRTTLIEGFESRGFSKPMTKVGTKKPPSANFEDDIPF